MDVFAGAKSAVEAEAARKAEAGRRRAEAAAEAEAARGASNRATTERKGDEGSGGGWVPIRVILLLMAGAGALWRVGRRRGQTGAGPGA